MSSFDPDVALRYNGSTSAFIDVFVNSDSGGLNGPDAGMAWEPDGNSSRIFPPRLSASTGPAGILETHESFAEPQSGSSRGGSLVKRSMKLALVMEATAESAVRMLSAAPV